MPWNAIAALSFLTFLTSSTTADPVVRMLVPGFTVQEVPIRISNINNLRFAPDGRLTALGYDGRVHLLFDTDGDGLEDASELFWDKSPLRVPVGMVWAPEGLYVSSQGKVSLLSDTNGDGQADREEIIAQGWPRTDVASGGVDATAITRDSEGNLYFGLLVANYANAYRLKDGVSHYDIDSPRGTIQKWSRATRQLETISTGIRVPYTLAFNRHGDLFVTDQEGETWLPGGNPLDELNHIITGRHYGFPPRHPVYLPDVIDEPPLVAFGPQHQSTCGMVFNESAPGQKSFGPKWWEGDVFIAGQSRGKIWRVRLVKTAHGYVGKQTLIARLSMLTTDLAISPRGDLYVSCHSGKPDWGTGPQGEGKIFKISYTDPQAPQPIAAWPAGPMETFVAFDQPLSDSVTAALVHSKTPFGAFVTAADRFETLQPPYQTVKDQAATPRGKLRVVSAQLLPDRQTLSLTTDPHPQSATYALTLPDIKSPESHPSPRTIDLAYDLHGLEAGWTPSPGRAAPTKIWLPHLSSEVNRAFLAHSKPHQEFAGKLSREGMLHLRAQLNFPPGHFTLRFTANSDFSLNLDGANHQANRSARNRFQITANLNAHNYPVPFHLELPTGNSLPPILEAAFSSETDPTVRPMRFEHFQLPWAPSPISSPKQTQAPPADLAGGDWERGRSLYFSEKLNCAACHRIRGQGSDLGPDLSNLIHRDPASVLQDLLDPDASINPDYVAFHLSLRDGSDLTGLVRAHDEHRMKIITANGAETLVPNDEITSLQSSPVSLMPSGLLDELKESQIRDLLTFLLHEPPRRSRTEIDAILNAAPRQNAASLKPLRIVLVATPQTYPPGQHDHPAWQKNWAALLSQSPNVQVDTAQLWPSPGQFETADLLVFYYWNKNWNPQAFEQLDAFLERGGGMVLFHCATIADKDPEGLALRIGLAAQPQRVKYLHAPINLHITAPPDHPITRGIKALNLLDEPYWPMIGDTNRIEVLATTRQDDADWPMLWTFQRGNGRVFASIPGHYSWTFQDPLFRILALRGLAWAAKENTARFEPLALIDADFD